MKKYLSLLKIFVTAILTILFFRLFGSSNLTIGLGVIIISLSLVGRDLTEKPILYAVKFSSIQVAIGVLAYIAMLNQYATLILTFLVGFIMYYKFSDNNNGTSRAMGFMETYILLMFKPVALEAMPIRLLALALSGIVIMVVYYILFKCDFEKSIDKKIIDAIESMKKELENISQEDKDTYEINRIINTKLKDIEAKLYRRVERSEDKLENMHTKIIIVALLQRINIKFLDFKKNDHKAILAKEELEVLDDLSAFIKGEISKMQLKQNIEKHLDELKINENESYLFYEVYKNLRDFSSALSNQGESIIKYKEVRKEILSIIMKKSSKWTSLKFNIAIKTSILLAVSSFIMKSFNVTSGYWLVLTICIVSLPYAEQTAKKSLDRAVGTIVGVVLFDLVFYIIQSKVVIILLIMLSLVLMLTIVKYNIRAIFITFLSVALVSISNKNIEFYTFAEYRLIFVVSGCILATLVFNYVAPYKLKDKTYEILDDIKKINLNFINIIKSNDEVKIKKKKLREGLITNKYFFTKLIDNNNHLKDSDIEEIMHLEAILTLDVKSFYRDLEKIEKYDDFIKDKCKKFEEYLSLDSLKEEGKREFYLVDSSNEKLLLIRLYKIYSRITDISLKIDKIER